MFEEAIKQLKKIDLEKIALKEFESMKEEAFDLNTEDQLFSRGVDAHGVSLGDYAPLTIRLRSEAGLPVDRITTRVEGDFHAGWEANFSRWPVFFTSSDSKTGELIFLFGEDIFGLEEKNISKLIEDGIKEGIQKRFKESVSNALKVI